MVLEGRDYAEIGWVLYEGDFKKGKLEVTLKKGKQASRRIWHCELLPPPLPSAGEDEHEHNTRAAL